MRILRYCSSIVLLLLATAASAQFQQAPTASPAKWKYEVKKKSGNDYQLILHLELAKGWHIWSLTPGGDGFQIVPSVAFDNNPNVQLKGKLTEKGHATTTTMDGVDGKVTYLSGNVDYIQEVTVKGSTRITGKHTWQVCDDKQCLAPTDKDFVFEIK
ncbi:hypothetical protein GCM10023093_20840 [Nemorincola caseinilytica]|uniref:Thiol:disulfide interchange protein DsbD N-terminal domain-containing protein n=1 Tax=Nemorincola caseinilytica TaxID=2054315 RepID=A0ABP8NGF7_9BACT